MDAKRQRCIRSQQQKIKSITYLKRLRVLPARLAWRFGVRGIKRHVFLSSQNLHGEVCAETESFQIEC